MQVRFTKDGRRIAGVKGVDAHGQWWIASPNLSLGKWEVGTIDQFRVTSELIPFTSNEFADWTEHKGISWVDQGNGIFLYSQDMEVSRGDRVCDP